MTFENVIDEQFFHLQFTRRSKQTDLLLCLFPWWRAENCAAAAARRLEQEHQIRIQQQCASRQADAATLLLKTQ